MKDDYVDMQRGQEVIKGVHVDAVPGHMKIGWKVVVPEKAKQLSAEEKAEIKAAADAAKAAEKAEIKAAADAKKTG